MAETDSESNPTQKSGHVESFDVLRFSDGLHQVVPAGDGSDVVTAHESEARMRRLLGSLTVGVLPVTTAVTAVVFYELPALLLVAIGFLLGGVAGVVRYLYHDHRDQIPEIVASNVTTRVVRDYVDDFDPGEVSPPSE
jgi:hypothetical protein